MRRQWFVVLPMEDRLPRPHCHQPGCQLEVMHGVALAPIEEIGEEEWHLLLFCHEHAEELRAEERKP